jgi:Domain of unknown function (DUF4347)
MNHLIVIGKREGQSPDEDRDMEIVYGWARRRAKRCSTKKQLVELVELASRKRPIDLLDIYYHGSEGTMYIGGRGAQLTRLFWSDESLHRMEGWKCAERLAHHLSKTAQVRLLGCMTAADLAGRMLLFKLARELGEHRTVLGTISDVIPAHFNPKSGLFEYEPLLFSSHACLDGIAPSLDDRRLAMPGEYPGQ